MTTTLDTRVFRVEPEPGGPRRHDGDGTLTVRAELRALAGMQKEAIVGARSRDGAAWRLVSDEGPYLNGTDLAPFPLAFFTAGLQFCLVGQIIGLAERLGIALDGVTLDLDSRYSMVGSILRGDMTGGAQAAEGTLAIASPVGTERIRELVDRALAGSPCHAVMREPLVNAFALDLNGRRIDLPGMCAPTGAAPDPAPVFDRLAAGPRPGDVGDAVTKVSAADAIRDVDGGAGTSLQPEQKRTLHVSGACRVLHGALLETVVRLHRPIGSTFRFVSDAGGEWSDRATAPPPIAYLSAGIGFCFMTQLGRYGHITKQHIGAVRVVQDAAFVPSAPDRHGASALPVETHVFVEADQSDADAQRLVRMGEQTCFLHAAMRGSFPTILRTSLNGRPLDDPGGSTAGA